MGDKQINKFTKIDKQSNAYERTMDINLAEMQFVECDSNKDDKEKLKFLSVEHLDSAQLKYFIKEKDAIFIRHKDEAFV